LIKNQKCPLERSLLKKECMKMIKFTIKKKNKDEDSKKKDDSKNNNKGDMTNKIRRAIKSLLLLQIMKNKHGKRYSQSINLNLDLLLKNKPQIILFIKLHKTQVKWELINKESIKNLGEKMLKIKMKKKTVAVRMMKKKHS
jgi:hypothetical protein